MRKELMVDLDAMAIMFRVIEVMHVCGATLE